MTKEKLPYNACIGKDKVLYRNRRKMIVKKQGAATILQEKWFKNKKNEAQTKTLSVNEDRISGKDDAAAKLRRLFNFLKPYNLSEGQSRFIQRAVLGYNTFLTGGAGVGKSFALRLVYEFLQLENVAVYNTAPTATAARNLIDGQTLHDFCGITPHIPKVKTFIENSLKNPKKQKTKRVRRWRDCEVLIIDEISMVTEELFSFVIQVAREFLGGANSIQKLIQKEPYEDNDERWQTGGVQIIVCGDFYQLPPIISATSTPFSEEKKRPYCFYSPEWNRCFHKNNTIALTEVFRQKDPVFIKVLNELRLGQLSEESNKLLESRVLAKGYWNLEDVAKINQDENLKKLNFDALGDPTTITTAEEIVDGRNCVAPLLITTHRRKVDEHNDRCIRELTSDNIAEYEATYSDNISESQKERLKKMCAAPEKLLLREGARIMLCINVDVALGLYNGLRGTLIELQPQYVVVQFDNWKTLQTLSTYEFSYEDEVQKKKICLFQIPLVLSYAITVHKCQSLSLDSAIIDVSQVFETGQVYTAISRVNTLNSLYLTSWSTSDINIESDPEVMKFYRLLL